MSPQPDFGLTVAYWLHMVGTVLWLGGLSLVVILVLPLAQRHLEGEAYQTLTSRLQSRLQNLGWFSLLLMLVTGLFQMSSNDNYRGFLVIDSPWAVAIIIKHIFYGAMLLVTAYLTWGLGPLLQRASLVAERQGDLAVGSFQRLQSRQKNILVIDLLLGVIILALTAVARASS